MAGIAAFFANVFIIDGLARDKVLRDRCRHMNARREPPSRTRPRPPTTPSSLARACKFRRKKVAAVVAAPTTHLRA
jgi:hypothetical protein